MRHIRVYLALCIVALASAANGETPVPKGPAFSDPAMVQEMPADWVAAPIKHDAEAGEADMVIVLDQNQYIPLKKEAEQFAAMNKLKIVIKEGTCGISAGGLAKKAIDVGGFCCPAGAEDRLPGLRFHTVGIVPLAILVNAKNPVGDVSLKDVRRIFGGEISNWKELKDSKGRPGPDMKILVIGRLHCKMRPGHWRLLLDNEDMFSPRMQEVGTIPDVLSRVASNTGAIGYEIMHFVDRFEQTGKVKPLKIGGHPPDITSTLAGSYPFYNTLNVTTWEGGSVENPKARELVKHLIDRADNIDRAFGIVPASSLRKAGWRFSGDELVGEP